MTEIRFDRKRPVASRGARLTPSQAAEIRRIYRRGGVSQNVLAHTYGVSQKMVSLIVRRKVWVHA